MNTFYVVRVGWNAANQSSVGTVRNPKNDFESGRYRLVAIEDAESPEHAVAEAAKTVTCYNGQYLFATNRPRSVKGLTVAAESFIAGELRELLV